MRCGPNHSVRAARMSPLAMRWRLRALLILLAVGPPVLAWAWINLGPYRQSSALC
jgi:hypothetical protein